MAKKKAKTIKQEAFLIDDSVWTIPWKRTEILEKVYLSSFAGLMHSQAAKILRCKEKELLEALKAFPEVAAYWDRGQEEIVSLCHVALTQRIRGMKTTEVRRTTKADGGVDETVIVKELPPDVDAIKFFLGKRLAQYQESNPIAALEGRVDTMLSKMDQLDMFSDN